MDGGKGCVFEIFTTSNPLPPATRLPPRDAPWGHDTPCGREFNFTISQHKIHEDPTWDPEAPPPTIHNPPQNDWAAEYQLALAPSSWI